MNVTGKNLVFSQDTTEIDLVAIINELWRKKWLILLVTTFFFSCGFFYSYQRSPQYQTDILLQIGSNKQNNSALGGLTAKLDLGNTSDNSAVTHSALIQSRFILEPVINKLGLDIKAFPKQSFFTQFFSSGKNKIKVARFQVSAPYVNQAFKLVVDKKNHILLYNEKGKLELQGNIGSKLTNQAKTIHLYIESINAPPGAQFTLIKQSGILIVKQLLRQLKIKDLGTKEETGVLQISLHGTNPHKLILILDAIAQQAQLKDAEKKSLEASKALQFLNQQLPQVKKSLAEAEEKLNAYREKSGKIDIKIQTQSLLTQLEELDKQLSTLRIKKIEMLQQYTIHHPYLVTLLQQTRALEKKRQDLEKKLKSLPASDQIAVNLMRDVKIKNSLYLILLNKVQELEFLKAGTVSNIRILSYAKLPNEPLPNRNGLIYAGSLLLGLAFSFLIIFTKKILSPQINDPYWIEQHFNLVNLCIIPFCKEQSTHVKKLSKQPMGYLPLLAQYNPKHVTIEALRSLRTSLQVSLNCATNNVISILGISPGVGKTFISTNLAWLLAVSGKRVLLIDGDLRRGIVHKKFHLETKPGLVDLINDQVTSVEVLKTTAHPNLTVLPRGSNILDPSELLMSDKFKEILHAFKTQFDLVIIDTAPVLQVTDGVLIARHSGTNYLVLGASAHEAKEVLMVIKRLQNANIQIHGSIYNYFKSASRDLKYSRYNAYYEEESFE